jgi:hypothetical protein
VHPDGNLPLSSRALEIFGELSSAWQGEGERGLLRVSSQRRGDAGREQMAAERVVCKGARAL